MNAYKIMRAAHYKLGSVVETSNANYGNRTGRFEEAKLLADAAVEICAQSKATFQQLIDLIHAHQSSSSDITLPPSITKAQGTKLKFLARSAPCIVKTDFGTTFWEALYERIRQTERPACPSRLKSYFAARDADALRRYRDKHWSDRMGDKLCCLIDISACPVAFDADTAILDAIHQDMTFKMARLPVLQYWDQERTSDPIMEVLFQGTVVLGEQVQL